MAKDIEVSQLIINKLTKAQYDEALDAGNIVDTELYMITDDEDSSASHPTYTARDSGLYKITVDDMGHVSDATLVQKQDIVDLGIPGQSYDDTNLSTRVSTLEGYVGDSTVASQVSTAVSNVKAVLYTAQTLTDAQKTQVRTNIGVDAAISAAIGTAIGGSY